MRVQIDGSGHITDVERPDHVLNSGTIVAFGIDPPAAATGWPTGFTVTGTAGSRVLKDPHGQTLATEETAGPAPTSSGASGDVVERLGPFTLAWDTPHISDGTGVTLWTANEGDLVLTLWADVAVMYDDAGASGDTPALWSFTNDGLITPISGTILASGQPLGVGDPTISGDVAMQVIRSDGPVKMKLSANAAGPSTPYVATSGSADVYFLVNRAP